MREPLQTWANEHEPDKEKKLKYESGYWEQIIFIRDRVSRLFGGKDNAFVVGTHTSKSVLLPVCRIDGDDITLQLRYNFHNVILSVISEKPIKEESLMGLIDPSEKVHEVHAEGFDRDWVFGSFNEDPQRWTAQIYDLLHLYVLLFRITDDFKEAPENPAAVPSSLGEVHRVDF